MSFETHMDGTVLVATMNTGENRHNPEFAQNMTEVLVRAEEDKSVTAMVLASEGPKFYSLGIDLDWMMARFGESDMPAITGFMYAMNDVFKKMLLLPVPLVAAINGHAFGNGAIMCCACDFRFMRSDRGYFCFPEVDLGIPFLPGMMAFVKKAMPYHLFNEMKLSGRKAGAQELAEHHFLTKASADSETLLSDAISYARTFVKKRGIFSEHKKRMHKHIIDIIDTRDPEYIDSGNLFVPD